MNSILRVVLVGGVIGIATNIAGLHVTDKPVRFIIVSLMLNFVAWLPQAR